jgi:hypothetical protein
LACAIEGRYEYGPVGWSGAVEECEVDWPGHCCLPCRNPYGYVE